MTGYITIMPLKHETIEKLMEGKLRGWDIKAEDILPFTPGVPLECFTGIAVRVGVKQPKKIWYAPTHGDYGNDARIRKRRYLH